MLATVPSRLYARLSYPLLDHHSLITSSVFLLHEHTEDASAHPPPPFPAPVQV